MVTDCVEKDTQLGGALNTWGVVEHTTTPTEDEKKKKILQKLFMVGTNVQ